MADIRFVAKQYIDAGWSVVPLVKGEKRASSKWQATTYSPSDFKADDGIAGKCGEPSGWRVDVDLDAKEAVEAAKELLPDTGLIHGRAGKPSSHYWYLCEGAKTSVWKDVKDTGGQTATLVEIRSTGGYTALPPSGHPSGEFHEWVIERAPLKIAFDELTAGVRNVAIATLLARHWPGTGARHHMVGHLAGFLLRYKIDPMMVPIIIKVAATIAKDPDVHDRVVFAQGTCAKYAADPDAQLTGGPKLAEALGDDVVARLRTWLGAKDEDALEQMNQKHFVVRLGKDEVIGTEDGEETYFQFAKSLALRYANQKIQVGVNKKGEPEMKPVFQAWLEYKSRRDFRSVTFAPPPRVADERDYNLWKGFAIEPAPGDCSLFLGHLYEVICSSNQEHYDYLINLLALTCQEPGTPSEVATVLRGEPGTGKGIFVRAMGDLFGRHYVHVDKVDDLVGHFNASLSGKVIVFADEAFWAGDKREAGALKRIITEPTLTVTRKGIDSVQEPNHVHLFMATNENWAVPAQLKERRFFAMEVSNCRRGDFEYFELLTQQLKNGGLAGFLDMMLKHPVDKDLIRRVPKTKELRAQQSMSLSPEMEWWQEFLYNEQTGTLKWVDFAWVPVSVIYSAYEEWLNRTRKGRLLSTVEFGRRMGIFISARKSMTRRINSESVRAWEFRSLKDARDYFDSQLTTTTDWPEPLDPPTTGKLPDPF